MLLILFFKILILLKDLLLFYVPLKVKVKNVIYFKHLFIIMILLHLIFILHLHPLIILLSHPIILFFILQYLIKLIILLHSFLH